MGAPLKLANELVILRWSIPKCTDNLHDQSSDSDKVANAEAERHVGWNGASHLQS